MRPDGRLCSPVRGGPFLRLPRPLSGNQKSLKDLGTRHTPRTTKRGAISSSSTSVGMRHPSFSSVEDRGSRRKRPGSPSRARGQRERMSRKAPKGLPRRPKGLLAKRGSVFLLYSNRLEKEFTRPCPLSITLFNFSLVF